MATTNGNSGWLSTNNAAIKQMLSWEIVTGNAVSNTSSVTLRFLLKKDPAVQNLTTTSTYSNFTLSCDGQTYMVNGVARTVYADNVAYEMVSHTFTVTHNTDGTKSATFAIAGGLGGTSIYYYTLQISRTVTLPSINRNSAIDAFPSFTFGNATQVKFTPKHSSFSYKIKFKLGSHEWTTPVISPISTSQYTYSTTFNDYDVWLPNIADRESGTMTAYLYTYANSSGTTQIGAAQQKTCTATVPRSIVPTLHNVVLTPINTNSVISGWGINVEGFTTFNLSGTASGIYGSTISSFVLSGGYSGVVNSSRLNYTGGTVTSGEKIFNVRAVDSRGRSSSIIENLATVYQYSRPVITNCTISRNPTNSTEATLRIDCTYSSCNNNNELSVSLKYKESTSDNYTTYSGDVFINQDTVLSLVLEDDKKYDFIVSIQDSVMSDDDSCIYRKITVQTSTVLLDFRRGGKGFGIGRVCATDALEIALPTKFYGTVYIYDADADAEISLADYIRSVISS